MTHLQEPIHFIAANRLDDERRAHVETKLLEAAYSQLRLSLLLTLGCIALFSPLMWAMAPAALSSIWTGSLLLVLVFRGFLYWAYLRAKASGAFVENLRRWQRLFFAGALASGAAWTLGPVLIIPLVLGGAELSILVAALLFVCSFALSSLVAQQGAARAFYVTTLVPPAVVLVLSGGTVQQMVAIQLVAGLVCMLLVGRKTGLAIRLQLEQEFELQRAVAAAESARERFFDLYDVAPVGYCTVGGGGEIVEANLTAASQLGVLRGSLTGRLFTDFVIGEDRHLYSALCAQLEMTGTPQACELRMVKDDGSQFWAHLETTAADVAGGVPAIRIVLSDATEQQRRAAAAVQESEARYRALVEWSPEPTVVHRNGTLLYVNPAFASMIGAPSKESLLGRSLMEFVHPDFQEVANQRMQSLRDGALAAPLIEMRGIKVDGSPVFVETQGITIDYDGQPASQVVVRDITARKQAEAARETLEAQLRESQKMEAIGTLAGGVAHDFNNILATILGNTELARQDAAGNRQALESLGEIQKAAARARDLVQQILSFSRRQPTERKPIALAAVVEESVRLLRATMPARITLVAACADSLPPVLADATQIQQVVINLATNAMQAMSARPGRIEVRLDCVQLDGDTPTLNRALRELGARHAGKVVRLTVSDDGRGMDPATLERIFEPFFTTKPVNEGTGLGLSVVHGIIEAHEGVIVVHSKLGDGSTFEVYLPPVNAEPSSAQVEAMAAVGQVMTKRETVDACIVYIDDDEAMVFLVERLLTRRGYRVKAYTDQTLALQELAADPTAVDVVVSDYNMPGMSGLEVASAIKSINEKLPVLIASGFVDEALHQLAAEAGVKQLIFKATAVEDFCEVISEHVQLMRRQ